MSRLKVIVRYAIENGVMVGRSGRKNQICLTIKEIVKGKCYCIETSQRKETYWGGALESVGYASEIITQDLINS